MIPSLTVQQGAGLLERVRRAVGTRVVGQEATVSDALVGFLARGHVLVEGVPGTAKTLLVRSLAGALGLRFGRIQFTPDLMSRRTSCPPT
jgi:MoxR-like ATPase